MLFIQLLRKVIVMPTKIDFIGGNTKRCLMAMALPMIAAMFLNMMYNLVDSLWIGNLLGETAYAALTNSTPIILILTSVAMGATNGVSILISQAIGAKDKKKTESLIATSFSVAVAFSFLVTILLEAFLPGILKVLNTPAETYDMAYSYLAIYTVLENYYGYRQQLLQRMAKPPISPADLWLYGEILYRIGVLETCQMYLRSAPITREVPCLQGHYMMLDAYVQNLARERRYGPNRGPDTQKERDAAQVNLERVIQDYRKRFTGFQPAEPEAYQKEIGRVITTLLPAWLQYRNTFVPLKNKKEENRS